MLADNGGPTLTMSLLTGSPALNPADDDTSAATDQRGTSRLQGAHCDVGAYEKLELAKNGGFKTYSTKTSKKTANWVAGKFGTLDGKNTTKKYGMYSVKLTGAGTNTKTLTQTLVMSGLANNAFTFSYWVKGSALPKTGTCQAQAILYRAFLKSAEQGSNFTGRAKTPENLLIFLAPLEKLATNKGWLTEIQIVRQDFKKALRFFIRRLAV